MNLHETFIVDLMAQDILTICECYLSDNNQSWSWSLNFCSYIVCALRILRDTEKKHDFECESRRMPTPLSMNSSFTIVITIFSEFLVAAAAALHFPLLRIESIREEFSYFLHSIFTETFSHFINNKPLRFESLFSSFFFIFPSL